MDHEGLTPNNEESALNSIVLEYYKRFGRKRDLEQFFSLSTVQGDFRDPLFWRTMKSENSSDSTDSKNKSSKKAPNEPIASSSTQTESASSQNTIIKESESPPIVIEDANEIALKDDDILNKSDDNQSQKSLDATLDISINKAVSPTSSVTSQRKLEWDSLADVGYGMVNKRKESSELSTLEKLALKQQYNNGSKQNIGQPAAHSTLIDHSVKILCEKPTSSNQKMIASEDSANSHKLKKDMSLSQTANISSMQQISSKQDFCHDSTHKKCLEHKENLKKIKPIKEIKRSYNAKKTVFSRRSRILKKKASNYSGAPLIININTMKKRNSNKKPKTICKKLKKLKKSDNIQVKPQDINTEQHSEAESFEYMPGHMYNQSKQHKLLAEKSSLESSDRPISNYSGSTSNSFSKDLEKYILFLDKALKKKQKHRNIKNQLIKEVVQKLVKTKYRDDNTSDYLSGLTNSSKKLTDGTTTSPSDVTELKPKKSILRSKSMKKISYNSQSAPDLYSITAKSNNNSSKTSLPNMNSNASIKCKEYSCTSTSSNELFGRFLDDLKTKCSSKYQSKPKHFDKSNVCSDTVLKIPENLNNVNQEKLKGLIKYLTKNRCDDGSGDASKVNGATNDIDPEMEYFIRNQKSRSVFTVTSENSNQNSKVKESHQQKTSRSKPPHHLCCCSYNNTNKVCIMDSSVQVNIDIQNDNDCLGGSSKKIEYVDNEKSDIKDCPRKIAEIISDEISGDFKYLCLCGTKKELVNDTPEKLLIHKCFRLHTDKQKPTKIKALEKERVMSKSSQTDLNLNFEKVKRKLMHNDSSKGLSKNDSNYHSQNPYTSFELAKNVDSFSNDSKKSKSELNVLVQTEISVDPMVSDPSLSDINIINQADCVKVVSHQHKHVSTTSLVTDLNLLSIKGFDSSNPKSGNSTDKSSKNQSTENNDKNLLGAQAKTNYLKPKFKSDTDILVHELNDLSLENTSISPENFSIPIKGTNMTLMVTIDQKEEITKTLVSKGVLTDRAEQKEGATSLLEECSKSIQYDDKRKKTHKRSIAELSLKNSDNFLPETINNNLKFRSNTYPKQASKTFGQSYSCSGDENSSSKVAEVTKQNVIKKHQLSKNSNFQIIDGKKANIDHISNKDNTYISNDANKKNTPCHSQTEVYYSKNIDETESKNDHKYSNNDIQNTNSNCNFRNNILHNTTSSMHNHPSYDPIIKTIKDISKRYSKERIGHTNKQKCFKEIMAVLKYLMDTEEDSNLAQSSHESETNLDMKINKETRKDKSTRCDGFSQTKNLIDKAVQLPTPKRKHRTFDSAESSELPVTSDMPSTSSDSATCKILNKIKKECEKYHQKRCKSQSGVRNCEISSSTSVSCDHCKHIHHCPCKSHKSKAQKTKQNAEKAKKKCVAYNLIIQTSDSLVSEEVSLHGPKSQPLKNIFIKVPPKNKVPENIPFRELSAKIEKKIPKTDLTPTESYILQGADDDKESYFDNRPCKEEALTIRNYLDKNRPDFIVNSSNRQHCLKMLSESRANSRAMQRELLSMLARNASLSRASPGELRQLAQIFAINIPNKSKDAAKSKKEQEMKKHSERIYKSLPEVTKKKQDAKKENLKRSNLLMANIFKKNLQKKILHGVVNISNYSPVMRIE